MRISDWSSDVCSSDLQASHRPTARDESDHQYRKRTNHQATERQAFFPGAFVRADDFVAINCHIQLSNDPIWAPLWHKKRACANSTASSGRAAIATPLNPSPEIGRAHDRTPATNPHLE